MGYRKIPEFTKDNLYILYVGKRKSIWEIAKTINCSHTAVLRNLKKYNIPVRSRSEALQGKLLSEYHRKRLMGPRPHTRGENRYNWQGGVSKFYPSEWTETLRESIRQRDNYICQICGKEENELIGCHKKLSVHHIDYDKNNLNPKNLITLCQICHLKTNAHRRKEWTQYFIIMIKE